MQTLCTILCVSRSAYYKWLAKKESLENKGEEEIERVVTESFSEHKRRYGVRRLVAELKAKGIQAGEYTVRQILKKHGLKAIQPRSFIPKTTDSRHPYAISPNLLLDRSLPLRPNEVWVGV